MPHFVVVHFEIFSKNLALSLRGGKLRVAPCAKFARGKYCSLFTLLGEVRANSFIFQSPRFVAIPKIGIVNSTNESTMNWAIKNVPKKEARDRLSDFCLYQVRGEYICFEPV